MATDLDVFILGPTEARSGDAELPLGAGKPRQILTALALDVGETVSVDRLIDVVWGEEPSGHRHQGAASACLGAAETARR